MQVPPPPLLPILRSRLQGTILARTHLDPDREFSLGELARLAQGSTTATSHEVDRLVSAGLLDDRRVGNLRLIKRGRPTAITRPLTELLTVAFGPVQVLSRLLSDVEGIEQAYVYGSWAARYVGQVGPPPHDIDVLVIGNPDMDELDSAAERARQQLGNEVNIRRVRHATWQNTTSTDPFITTVRSRPMVEINLEKEA
ncbi:nucleotidyltransferase domain-containing protein [Promicromonospora soli]